MPTAAAIWLLTLSAIMADGRILTTHATYRDEARCLASGMITADRLQSSGVPAGYICTEVALESLTIEEAVPVRKRQHGTSLGQEADPDPSDRQPASQSPAQRRDQSPFLRAGPTHE